MAAFLGTTALTKSFGGLTVLAGLDLEVRQGEILGIIGPNGAGKTTLFNLVTGFLRPSSGDVWLEGRRITQLSPEERCALGLARTFQVPRPFAGMSVLDNVAVGALGAPGRLARARRRAHEIVHALGLGDHAHAAAGALPTGLRKRLEVARALATGPRLLMLDEVMGGLTPTEVNQMVAIVRGIRESGVTPVIIEHVMAAIMALSDRVIVLDQGMVIAEGTPSAVARDPAVIAAYLGDEVALT
jgi:branched-chain amino acid transport system ATP-binding protein